MKSWYTYVSTFYKCGQGYVFSVKFKKKCKTWVTDSSEINFLSWFYYLDLIDLLFRSHHNSDKVNQSTVYQ